MSLTLAPDETADGAAPSQVDLKHLGRDLQELVEAGGTDERAIARLVPWISSLLDAFGVVYLSRDDDDRLRVAPDHYAPEQLGHLPDLVERMVSLAEAACGQRKVVAARTASGESFLVVAAPVEHGAGPADAIAVAFSVAAQQSPGAWAWAAQSLQLLAAFIGQWKMRRQSAAASNEVRILSRLCRTLPIVASDDALSIKGHAVAAAIAELLDCQLAVIGVPHRRSSQCRVVGISTQPHFDRQAELLQNIETVLSETWISRSDGTQLAPAAEELSQTTAWQKVKEALPGNFLACYRLPSEEKAPAMVLLAAAEQDPLASTEGQQLLTTIERMATPLVELALRTEPGWTQRRLQQIVGRGSRYRRRIIAIAVLAAAAALACPVTYRVDCDCRIEPVERRHVSVPYEGRLHDATVSPGDVVRAGQILAVMDRQETEWELDARRAALNQAQQEYEVSLAEHQTARAQLARLEMQRLRLQTELLADRLEHLVIKSPLDGVVIAGDPTELIGARLSQGQTILEIGPLEQMRVELMVPDEDVAYVEAGQRVSFRLNAEPFRKRRGVIRHLHPQAETVDGQNVFIAEVEIEGPQDRLRPGMEGSSKIATERRPWGWNLFHKAWYALLYRFG